MNPRPIAQLDSTDITFITPEQNFNHLIGGVNKIDFSLENL